MAKRRTPSAAAVRSKRHRRTSEELIADLQRKIEEVRRRQETQKLKKSAAVRSALAALHTIDKGLASGGSDSDREVQLALNSAREPLASFLEGRGIELAKRKRKGRKAS